MLNPKEMPACPVETTLKVIGDKWKILILRDLLSNECMRFSELKRSLGVVTQKMLTQQLRQMEADGLIDRKVYPVVPPKVEYSLTEFGKTLRPVLDSMSAWGAEFKKGA